MIKCKDGDFGNTTSRVFCEAEVEGHAATSVLQIPGAAFPSRDQRECPWACGPPNVNEERDNLRRLLERYFEGRTLSVFLGRMALSR